MLLFGNCFVFYFIASLIHDIQYIASPSMYLPHSPQQLEWDVQQFVSPELAIFLLQPETTQTVSGVPYALEKLEEAAPEPEEVDCESVDATERRL